MKKPNIKLLEKVKKAILRYPKNTHMSRWVTHEDYEADCGTTGCIAGWAVAEASLSKLRKLQVKESSARWAESFESKARRLLGLDHHQGDILFKVDYWPWHWKDLYKQAKGRKATARIISQRIDEFIADNS